MHHFRLFRIRTCLASAGQELQLANESQPDKHLMCGWKNTTVPENQLIPMTTCKNIVEGAELILHLPTPPGHQAIDQAGVCWLGVFTRG